MANYTIKSGLLSKAKDSCTSEKVYLKYNNQEVGSYTGKLEKNVPDGEGYLIYKNMDSYQGIFSEGDIAGEGDFTIHDPETQLVKYKFIGNFQEIDYDMANYINFEGELQFAGQTIRDLKITIYPAFLSSNELTTFRIKEDCSVTIQLDHNRTYEGPINDKLQPHGNGIIRYKDEEKSLEGTWENDVLVKGKGLLINYFASAYEEFIKDFLSMTDPCDMLIEYDMCIQNYDYFLAEYVEKYEGEVEADGTRTVPTGDGVLTLDFGLFYEKEDYGYKPLGISRINDLDTDEKDREDYTIVCSGSFSKGQMQSGQIEFIPKGGCEKILLSGELVSGILQGRGTVTHYNQSLDDEDYYIYWVRQGEFIEGKFVIEKKIEYSAGVIESIQEGEFNQYDYLEGEGKETGYEDYSEGKVSYTLEGEFNDDGDFIKGQRMDYEDGELTSTYIGEFNSSGSFHGKGKYIWASGQYYEGDFYEDKFAGHGKEVSAKGELICEGLFIKDKFFEKEITSAVKNKEYDNILDKLRKLITEFTKDTLNEDSADGDGYTAAYSEIVIEMLKERVAMINKIQKEQELKVVIDDFGNSSENTEQSSENEDDFEDFE